MRICLVFILTTTLTACGTMSTIEAPRSEAVEPAVDFSAYDHVTVLDFDDATRDSDLPELAGRDFADQIALSVRDTGAYAEISRETVEGESLVVSGEVTRYAEGNAALRFMIGMGAGSSYFDAVVRFTDSETGEVLGELTVDRNSWVLGGGFAAGQTVEGFMDAAASRVAEELVKAKRLE